MVAERRRDPQATYNPMDRAQLVALAPAFDWTDSLAHIGLANMPTVVVREKSAVTAAGKQVEGTPLATWKAWPPSASPSDHADVPAARL